MAARRRVGGWLLSRVLNRVFTPIRICVFQPCNRLLALLLFIGDVGRLRISHRTLPCGEVSCGVSPPGIICVQHRQRGRTHPAKVGSLTRRFHSLPA
ncbi:hypothetical protein K525DRAFT_286029 [Schizophyllum commune Loenen D]|nr:hypothetical protein K525DRAFT_286029 [Schizophyllum commune Loenen D]